MGKDVIIDMWECNDENFKELVYGWFLVIFPRLLITTSYPYDYFTPFFTRQHGFEKANQHVPFHVHDIYIN